MSPARDRLAAAEVRATNAYQSICNKADAVLEELEDATDPSGCAVPKVEIHDEDSLVLAVSEAVHKKRAVTHR